jgi:hypothetical protein
MASQAGFEIVGITGEREDTDEREREWIGVEGLKWHLASVKEGEECERSEREEAKGWAQEDKRRNLE